ncbi:MAG TPA: type II secretion system protein [Candidatus Wallbacteria bacterium]|nr:type II secretion system protein [Candidatus Wallbacteria bacterium]
MEKSFLIGRQSNGERAFSFLEMMIAFAVILAGVIPVFTLVSTGNKTFAKSENNAIAYNLAIEALEWARSAPFEQVIDANVNAVSKPFCFPVSLTLNYQTKDNPPYKLAYPQKYFKYFSNFSREMKIENFGNKMKKVTVMVRWQEDNVQRKEEVSAVIIDQRLNY